MRPSKIQSVSSVMQDIRNDYDAAKSSRFRRARPGLLTFGSNADYHFRSDADYYRILELVRDFDRNDAIVGSTLDRAVINALQQGLPLHADTGDEAINKDVEARWTDWGSHADQCDVAGERNWHELEKAALRHKILDGDCLGIAARTGAIQIVESHRVKTPTATRQNVVLGVLLNDQGRHLQYWVTKSDIGIQQQVKLVGDMAIYPVRDASGNRQVMHVYSPKRVSQTRGVSVLAPIVSQVSMRDDIEFATLVKQQAAACFVIFRSQTEALSGDLGAKDAYGETSVAGVRTLEGMAPGMEITGNPGETFEGFSPSIPGGEFIPHMRHILTTIGINLGMPLCMVLMDASETNFSGYRGAIEQARMGFKDNQDQLVAQFHQPIYEWKMRQWIADDPALARAALRGGIRIFRHTFSRPAWPYIEPKTDAEADVVRIDNAQISPRRLHAERGREYDVIAGEIVEDRALMISMALSKAEELNKTYKGADISWRDLVPSPPAVTQALASATDAPEDPRNPKAPAPPKPQPQGGKP